MNQKRKLVRLTEADLNNIIRESVENILAENAEEEGFWGNVGNAVRRGMGALGNDQSLGQAWKTGKQQFKNLQAQDKDINTYNSMYKKYQDACAERDKLAQQYKQACQKVSQMSGAMGKRGGMTQDRWGQAKQAGRSGMDANQMDRQRRQQQMGAAS